MPRRVTVLIAGLLACGLLGCGGGAGSASPPVVVDERSGAVGGVRLGDGPAEIRRELGPGTDGRMLRRVPEDLGTEELGLPWTLDPLPGVERTRVLTMRRDGMSLLVAPRSGAYAISVWLSGARTKEGVAVGDDLEAASETYSGLRCGIRNRGTEYVEYPYCKGRLGKTYLWFGQDPIRSITVASTGLG
jgi:hypothetical protein